MRMFVEDAVDSVPLRPWVVTRHPAVIEWLEEYLGVYVGEFVVPHIEPEDAWSSVLIGNVPLHIAAVAEIVFAVEFDNGAPRGAEWTVEQMKAAGAHLTAYTVREQLPTKQVCSKCGGERDLSEHGRKWNLTVEDAGSPGGQTFCGDTHEWEPAE